MIQVDAEIERQEKDNMMIWQRLFGRPAPRLEQGQSGEPTRPMRCGTPYLWPGASIDRSEVHSRDSHATDVRGPLSLPD